MTDLNAASGETVNPRPDLGLHPFIAAVRRAAGRRAVRPFRLGFIMVLAACGGERTVAGPNGGNGSGPEFATLTVEVGLEEAGSDLGSPLGWETGVPEATVHVLRNGTATWMEGRSDGDGRAVFERLLPGLYRVYATRRLSSSEAQTAAEPIRAFGDGGTFTIPAGSSTVSMRLVADVPAGLVVSEVSPSSVLLAGTSYVDGMYFELYNSSAEVQYLDALLFGSAYHLGFQDWDHTPCSASEPARDDALGLNTTQVLQFPGQGSEYPIQAGETKLVAIAAIDHSAVDPVLVDLSGADFEIGGRANADNPAVPNMMEVGLTPFKPGHTAVECDLERSLLWPGRWTCPRYPSPSGTARAGAMFEFRRLNCSTSVRSTRCSRIRTGITPPVFQWPRRPSTATRSRSATSGWAPRR